MALLLAAVDRLNSGAGHLAALALAPIALFTCFEVIGRKAGYPTNWTNEVTVYLLMVSSFVGLGAVEQRRGHLAVTFFVELLPVRTRLLLDMLVALLGLAFSVALIVVGIQLVARSMALGIRTHSLMELPIWAIQGMLPLGMLLFGLQYLVRLVDDGLAWRQLAERGGAVHLESDTVSTTRGT